MDVAWVLDHLDDLAGRTFQHIVLASIALAVGFVISLGLAILAVRRRRTYAPIVAISDMLFVIPSLAIFSLFISITGITLLTVEIPLVMYTLLIYVRNIAAGFDSIPVDVLEAADGMGFTQWRRLRSIELPLAVPLIVAGLRLASVSTIGLVTITAVLGDSFGGLGAFILEGIRHSFPTEIYFGAIPSILLAVAADVAFVRIQRRVTPWSRTSALGRLA